MITPSGLFVPDPPAPAKPVPRVSLMLSPHRFGSTDNGYYGELIVRREGTEVRLRITDKEADTLARMDIAEYT